MAYLAYNVGSLSVYCIYNIKAKSCFTKQLLLKSGYEKFNFIYLFSINFFKEVTLRRTFQKAILTIKPNQTRTDLSPNF